MTRLTLAGSRLRTLAAGLVLLVCCFVQVVAQDDLTPPKVEVKGTVGGALFGEEIPHGVFGGSVRVYVSRRVSVEPEVLYMYNSPNDQDFLIQPNVAYDLTEPTGRVVPYVIGGVGVLHHQGRFFGFDFTTGAPRTFDKSATTWSASGGAGVKIFVTDRLFVAPEARIGSEPTWRGTFSVGYVLSGRDRN